MTTTKSSQPIVILEYCYRDFGNFKSYGTVMFSGPLLKTQLDELEACLLNGSMFIAEKVGIQELRSNLMQFGSSPDNDHEFHEVVSIRQEWTDEANPTELEAFSSFLAQLKKTSVEWMNNSFKIKPDWRENTE